VETRQNEACEGAVFQIIWSDQFELGHKQLDDEHRHLVQLINGIYLAHDGSWSRKAIGPLLDGFYNVAKQHFANENSILLNINRRPIPSNVDRLAFIRAMIDAAFERHLDEHPRLLTKLLSIIADIRKELKEPKPHLNSDLRDWFVEHATVYDAPLKPIFAALN
jgi:hemerythrin